MNVDIRPGEIAVALPEQFDAGVYFIGRIRTPWTRREDCPKNARGSDAVCTIELDPRYAAALDGVASLHASRRALFHGPGAARPRGAGAAAPRRAARHLRAALAGAAEPDRDERGAARARRRHDALRRRPRLPRRHAADRHQAVFRVGRFGAGRGASADAKRQESARRELRSPSSSASSGTTQSAGSPRATRCTLSNALRKRAT